MLCTVALTFRKDRDNIDGSRDNSRIVTFHAWAFHLDCTVVSQNLHGIGNQLKLEPMNIYFSKILN